MTRTAIIESFKRFFKIENRFIDEYEQLLIDWAEELTKSKSATCEANAQSVLSDVLTDEEIEDLQVRLYNHALLVICSELTAEERTRSRNNIIREWFGEMCSRYVR
jgi:hypothetical protein